MKLYFLRHGHAENAANGLSDEERRLTPEGTTRLHTAARVMAQLRLPPLHIYSSPRVRAYQTAEIVANALGLPFEVREEVNFGFNLAAIRTLMNATKNGADLMFVGHQPTLSEVIGHITGADVEMKPGGLARVDLLSLDPLRGTLVWLITPKVFDTLGQAAP